MSRICLMLLLCYGLMLGNILCEPGSENNDSRDSSCDDESVSEPDPHRKLHFKSAIENDRLNGTDNFHTHTFRFGAIIKRPRYDVRIHASHESLTRKFLGTRLDLLSIGTSLEFPFRRGNASITGGAVVNGNLGGQRLQNLYHRLLDEAQAHLTYPDRYAFGVFGGIGLDQDFVEIRKFVFSGSARTEIATNAGPSFFRTGAFVRRKFRFKQSSSILAKFGVTYQDFFLLVPILQSYYGSSFSLDSTLDITLGRFTLDLSFKSDPYGIDQSVFSVGIGMWF